MLKLVTNIKSIGPDTVLKKFWAAIAYVLKWGKNTFEDFKAFNYNYNCSYKNSDNLKLILLLKASFWKQLYIVPSMCKIYFCRLRIPNGHKWIQK